MSLYKRLGAPIKFAFLPLRILWDKRTPYSLPASTKAYNVIRLNGGKPIITRELFELAGASAEDGHNINGPSLIRIPDWLKKSGKVVHPDANYYLYFAHHKGAYIRLAWAAKLEGPWKLYNVDKPVGRRGVLDLGEDLKKELGNGISIQGHVASPDVLIDNENQRIIMYFHAPSSVFDTKYGQRTLAATSRDGLDFNAVHTGGTVDDGIRPAFLGSSYFKIFTWKGYRYAVANRGEFYRVKDDIALSDKSPSNKSVPSRNQWERRRTPLIPTLATQNGGVIKPRHAGVMVRGNTLWVFYTRAGDSPESILLSTINLDSSGWGNWQLPKTPEKVLKPETKWEGIEYAIKASKTGPGTQERALRDPAPFMDDGNYFLLYSGSGEEAIGIARLVIDSS